MHRGAHLAGALAASLAAGPLALGGCQFSSDHAGARFRCGDGESCPPGTTCVAGYCEAGAPDGGGPVGGEDAAPVAGPCGTISLVRDEFDGEPGGPWSEWAASGTAMSRVDGELVIEFSGDVERWAGATSQALFHVEGGEVRARVSEPGGLYTVLELLSPAGPKAQLLVVGGDTLRATVLGAPGGTITRDVAYDREDHAVWRLRAEDGVLFWETSADGASWDPLYQDDLALIGPEAWVLVAGGGQAGDPAVRVDSVNAGVTPPAGYCGAAGLVDPFDGAPVEPIWSTWADPGCAVDEAGGDLRFALPGDESSVWCGVDSTHFVDLSASELVIGPLSDEGGGAPGVYTIAHLGFPFDPTVTVEVNRTGSTLNVHVRSGEEETTRTTEHDPDAHRYWRLRGEDGRLVVEASPDAASWSELATSPDPLDLRAVRPSLSAGHLAGTATPAEIRFGGVNAP